MASSTKSSLRLSYNAPVVLTFAFACVVIQLISTLTGGAIDRVFMVGRALVSWNLLTWFRLFLHALGHSDWGHLFNNMMLFLILGPMIEEKYGSLDTLIVILATALVTGLIYVIFFPAICIHGASGVVFAFIILASITGFRERTIPLTFILVAALYIGQQIWQTVSQENHVAELSHIAGGGVGGVLGFVLNRRAENGRSVR